MRTSSAWDGVSPGRLRSTATSTTTSRRRSPRRIGTREPSSTTSARWTYGCWSAARTIRSSLRSPRALGQTGRHRGVKSGCALSTGRWPGRPGRPPWLSEPGMKRPLLAYVAAIGGPVTLTAAFGTLHIGSREYVFAYMGIVALLGFTYGLGPALACAATSFILVDYYFVAPVYSFTLLDEQDAFNLVSLIPPALLVRRRPSHHPHP